MDQQAIAQLMGNWGEFISSIGVLITLIYLSLQVAQAKKATRTQIAQSATDQINQVNLQIAADPTWAGILSKSRVSPDSMTPEERTRFSFLLLTMYRSWESLYFLHLDGYVDPRIWEASENAITRHATTLGWQQWWREQPYPFSREFSEYINGRVQGSVATAYKSNW